MYSFFRFTVVLLFLFIPFWIWTPIITAVSPPGTTRVIILLVDQLTWEDLLDEAYPSLRQLAMEAAVGLMNTRTGGVTNPENAAVTLGASSRAVATANGGQAFDRSTILQLDRNTPGAEVFIPVPGKWQDGDSITAAQVYERRTGQKAAGNILHLAAAEISSRNKSLQYVAIPGALGTELRKANISVAHFGNSDTTRPNRHFTMFLMDENGTIPFGSVDTPTRFAVDSPHNRKTDYAALWELVQQEAPAKGVIAIELGDLARVYSVQSHYDKQALEAMRQQVLSDIDLFVKQVVQTLSENDKLLVLVPTPPVHQIVAGNSFTPLLLWTKSSANPGGQTGLLTSPTTRRLGIVTNTDIAPTILSFFDIDTPSTMYGRKISVIPHSDPIPYLMRLRDQATATNVQRRSILRNLVYVDIFLYLAATAYILLKKLPRWIGRIINVGLPFMKAMPLGLLLLPIWRPATPTHALLGAVILSGFVVLALYVTTRHPLKLVIVLSLATALAVLIDTFTGNQLVKASILGYDPMSGARFYGVGNEYMGVLVGAAIIGTAPLLDLYPRFQKRLRIRIVLFYIIVTAAISLPMLGANVGGALTATIGLSVTVLLLYDQKISLRLLVYIALIPLLVILGNSVLDRLFVDLQTSHLGHALQLISSRGLAEVYSIIARKLTMNLKLFRYSVWSRVLIVALGVIIWFLYQPPPLIHKIKQHYPYLIKGLIGSTVAAVAALIFNDSGVVAAALVLNFTATTILVLGVRLTYSASID